MSNKKNNNQENLIPFRSEEEAREKGRKGGVASGEARRQKKAVAEYLKLMMDSDAPEAVADNLQAKIKGLQGEDITLTAAMAYKQIEKAIKGDIEAAKWITELYDKQTMKDRAKENKAPFVLSPMNLTVDFLEAYRVLHKALEPYSKDDKDRVREIISKGGRGTIKSSFWSSVAYEIMINDPLANVVFTRRFKVDLRDSVYAQWQRTVDRLGDLDEWTFTTSPMRAEYKPTGQMVYFIGADKPLSSKSFEVPTGYIKILINEESDEMQGLEQLDQIEDTFLRKDTPSLSIKIFNPPPSKNNFMNSYVADKEFEPTSYICHSYYYNVPKEWLGQRFFDRAEWFKEHKPQYYENNYLGKVTGTGGEVFKNVTERKIKRSEIANLPTYQGIDWGDTHPQVFSRTAYDSSSDTLFILKEHYRTRCKLLTFLKGIAKPRGEKEVNEELYNLYAEQETICDSATPDKIRDAQDYGWNAIAAVKRWKGGGRAYGWEWLSNVREIVIDPEITPKIAKELRILEFEKLRDGTFSSAYPTEGEDGIMATIYGLNRVIIASKDEDQYDYDYMREDED